MGCILGSLTAAAALTLEPVSMTGPVPAINGSAQTVVYTITSHVPQALPFTVSGISGEVTRTTVANDCGDVIPSGPISCSLGIKISPSTPGATIDQTLVVNYNARSPLTSRINTIARGTFAYVNNRDADTVIGYQVNESSGNLSVLASSPYGTGVFPNSIAVAYHQAFAYVANPNGSSISVYTIDAGTGALLPTSSSIDTGSASCPLELAIDPSGHYLYAADLCKNTVLGYIINQSDASLTTIPGSPFPAQSQTYSVVVDPAGHYLYATNNSGSISAYAIDTCDGILNEITDSPFAVSGGPRMTVITPDGKFAYTVQSSGNSLAAFSIDATTGALTQLPGSPYSTGTDPEGLNMNPDGTYLYVANAGSASLSGYSINTTTGALTPISGSPFATDSGPLYVKVDPTGQFAYAANVTSNTVTAYSLSSSTGALTPIPSSPFSGLNGPSWIEFNTN